MVNVCVVVKFLNDRLEVGMVIVYSQLFGKQMLLWACNLGHKHNLRYEHLNRWLSAHVVQGEGQVKIGQGCSPYVYYVSPFFKKQTYGSLSLIAVINPTSSLITHIPECTINSSTRHSKLRPHCLR